MTDGLLGARLARFSHQVGGGAGLGWFFGRAGAQRVNECAEAAGKASKEPPPAGDEDAGE